MADQQTESPADEAGEIEARAGTNAFKQAVANFIGQQGTLVRLHSTDPGAAGTTGVIATTPATTTTTWGAAVVGSGSNGVAVGKVGIVGSKISFTITTGPVNVTHFSVWSGTTTAAPGNFLYSSALALPATGVQSGGSVDVTPSHTYDVN